VCARCERLELPVRHGPVQVVVVLLLVIVGWALARDFVRGLEPFLFRRLDEASTGTAGFVIRLVAMLAAIIVALTIAGWG